jgi:hypothetical protein
MWAGSRWLRIDSWRALVTTVMNRRIPYNAGNFLSSWKPLSFSRRTLLKAVNYRVNYIRHYAHFLKASISFVVVVRPSVLPSVRAHRIIRPRLDGSKETDDWNFYKKKKVEKLHVLLNSTMENVYLHEDKHIWKTPLRRNFPKEFVDKIKKGILCLNSYLLKIMSFKW